MSHAIELEVMTVRFGLMSQLHELLKKILEAQVMQNFEDNN